MPNHFVYLKGIQASLWLFITLWLFSLVPLVMLFISDHYEKNEPFFLNPVLSEKNNFKIRNDKLGKGHFGATRGKFSQRRHEGIDIAADLNTDIQAPRSGRITVASPNKGYGEYIQIQHSDGWQSRYAHLSEILVHKGDWVKRGVVIGRVGKTGNANLQEMQPHLHFEIRRKGRVVDPRPLMDLPIS